MTIAELNGIHAHYRLDGPEDGPVVVFANSLGTDLRLWDPILPYLPQGLRILRYDKRGHGLSDAPASPYKMGTLVRDAEVLLEHLGLSGVTFVGLSIGGMIGQGLAAKRPELFRALVLSNTAVKIGTREMWQDRIDTVLTDGIDALADSVMTRWFSKAFQIEPELRAWRNMLSRQPDQGYAGCSAAIQGTDFLSSTSGLRLPTLGIAGPEDGSTPPDLVREMLDLIPGSEFRLIPGTGHLPCVERPREYAAALSEFIHAQEII